MAKRKKQKIEIKCSVPCKYCLQEHCPERKESAVFEPYKYLEEITRDVNDTIEFSTSGDYKFLVQTFAKYQKQEDIPDVIRKLVDSIYINCGFGSTTHSTKLTLLLKAFDYHPILDHKN